MAGKLLFHASIICMTNHVINLRFLEMSKNCFFLNLGARSNSSFRSTYRIRVCFFNFSKLFSLFFNFHIRLIKFKGNYGHPNIFKQITPDF